MAVTPTPTPQQHAGRTDEQHPEGGDPRSELSGPGEIGDVGVDLLRTVDGAFAVTFSSISQWLEGGGGGPGGGDCTGNNVWTGTATTGGGDLVTPNCSGGGNFQGELVCGSGAADLDLYLDKQTCNGWFGCSFGAVASSATGSCNESVNSNQSNGTYRWRVDHFSGPNESFTLCTNQC